MQTREKALAVTAEVGKAVLGKPEAILKIMMAMLARGHVLVEDIPGVGKTTLAQAFARAMQLTQNRVQFTPDVLPSDIVGFSLYQKETGKFVYHPGAVACNLFLADEINRTSARTQSALLEVMEEGAVTVDGVTRKLPQPFTVMATENPVGSIGTQMLPESQLDRFMVCVVMGYPDTEAEMEILTRQPRHGLLDRVQPVMDQNDLLTMQAEVDNIYMSEEILRYIVELSQATRKDARLALGLSPRASLAVAGMARAAAYLSGREFVVPQDVTAIFADTAHHRLSLTEQARTGGETVENVIADVLHDGVPVVIASQCQQAEVLLGHYETGDAIARAGAIGSGDMTREAAYAKIMVLLSQGVDAADFGMWMRRNIAGEISPSSM